MMARGKICFWLDFMKDDHLLVAETVDELKARRSFSSVVRDGIMIVNELRQGRVDLLLKLYPFVFDAIKAMLPPVDPPPTPPDNSELLRELRRMLMEYNPGLNPPPPDYTIMKPATNTLGQGAKLALPLDDDDDLSAMIVTKKEGGTSAASNLLASMMGLGD